MSRYLMIAVFLIPSCTSIEQVKEAHSVYCSGLYKGMRAVGRSALSATTGVVVSDVCDQIEEITTEASE